MGEHQNPSHPIKKLVRFGMPVWDLPWYKPETGDGWPSEPWASRLFCLAASSGRPVARISSPMWSNWKHAGPRAPSARPLRRISQRMRRSLFISQALLRKYGPCPSIRSLSGKTGCRPMTMSPSTPPIASMNMRKKRIPSR